MASEPIEVNLCGQRLLLKGDQDPAHIERLADYVRGKVDELTCAGGVAGPRAIVLAALNIADDYFRAIAESQNFMNEVAERSQALLRELEASEASDD